MRQKAKTLLDSSKLDARRVLCTDVATAIIIAVDLNLPQPLEREVKRLRCELAQGLREAGIGDYQSIEKVLRRLKKEKVLLRIRLPKDASFGIWMRVVKDVLSKTAPLRCDPLPRKDNRQSRRHVNRRHAIAHA